MNLTCENNHQFDPHIERVCKYCYLELLEKYNKLKKEIEIRESNAWSKGVQHYAERQIR